MPHLEGQNDNGRETDEDRRRQRQNLIAAVWVVALLCGGYWLVQAFIENNRQQECLARQHRNCIPLDVKPAR